MKRPVFFFPSADVTVPICYTYTPQWLQQCRLISTEFTVHFKHTAPHDVRSVTGTDCVINRATGM